MHLIKVQRHPGDCMWDLSSVVISIISLIRRAVLDAYLVPYISSSCLLSFLYTSNTSYEQAP